MYVFPLSPPSTPSSSFKEVEVSQIDRVVHTHPRMLCHITSSHFILQEDTNVAHSYSESCQSEMNKNVDLDAVQSLLAMSQWSPPCPERNTPSPDSGLSSISRNSSTASLSSTTSVESDGDKTQVQYQT